MDTSQRHKLQTHQNNIRDKGHFEVCNAVFFEFFKIESFVRKLDLTTNLTISLLYTLSHSIISIRTTSSVSFPHQTNNSLHHTVADTKPTPDTAKAKRRPTELSPRRKEPFEKVRSNRRRVLGLRGHCDRVARGPKGRPGPRQQLIGRLTFAGAAPRSGGGLPRRGAASSLSARTAR